MNDRSFLRILHSLLPKANLTPYGWGNNTTALILKRLIVFNCIRLFIINCSNSFGYIAYTLQYMLGKYRIAVIFYIMPQHRAPGITAIIIISPNSRVQFYITTGMLFYKCVLRSIGSV